MDAKHVSALFAEANPVPDVEEVRRELGPSAVDLTTLESRSRAMDIKHLNQLEPAAPPKRRWRPALVFTAALVLVIVAIGGVALLLQGDTPPVVDEPATTVAPPVTTEAPVTTTEAPVTTVVEAAPAPPPIPPLDEGWEVFTVDEGQPTMMAGFVDGIGWIAAGDTVMVSTDGIDWIEVDAEGVISGDAGFLIGVVPGGPGALAYGWTCEGERCPAEQGPALYGSADGTTWERITSDAFHGCAGPLSAGCYSGIQDMAVGIDGSLMASGPDATLCSDEEPFTCTTESIVWTSDDGYTWLRHDVPLDQFIPDGWFAGAESLGNLIYTGDRWFAFLPVYYRSADSDFEEGVTLVLESQTGAEWTVVDTDAFTVDATPDVIVGGPNGLFAVGGQTTWWSADGQDWVQSTIPGDYWFDRAIALESGFLVYTREGPTVFGFSPDGITWVTVEAGDDLADVGWNVLSGAEADSDVTLVGVGYRDAGEGSGMRNAVITSWFGSLTD